MRVDYVTLGPLAAIDHDGPRPLGGLRQRTVLAVLLVSAERTVSVDELIDHVWDGQPPPKPLVSLRAYVANLRRILGRDGRTDRLVTDPHGYRLHLLGDRVDARLFEDGLARGKHLLEAGDAAAATRELTTALDRWQGPPLVEFRDRAFTHHEIHRLEACRADAVEARYEAELMLGRGAELVTGLEAEIAANPLREQLWIHLMLALNRAGRRTDALSAHRRLVDLLDDELGIRPGPEVELIAADIRRGTPPRPSPVPPPPSPAADALFGRTSELHRLRAALTGAIGGRGRLAVLTGESGVGKTSLAAALAQTADELGVVHVWVGHPAGVRTPPSWAWTQVVRALAEQTRTSPDIFDGSRHKERKGFACLEMLASSLAEKAGQRPTLIVIDDLHRADRTAYDVLKLLLGRLSRLPVLIVGTWQEGGRGRPRREHEFDRLMSRPETTLIRLQGIDAAATGQLIEAAFGVTPAAGMVEAISDRTGGNPFYIAELAGLLHDDGRLGLAAATLGSGDVPDAVAAVIRRRMADLPASTRDALTVAALLGGEFAPSVAAAALDRPAEETSHDLIPAVRTGFVVDAGPDLMRFRHGLVRDAITVQVTGTELASLHAQIARAFVALDRPAVTDSTAAADHAWRAGAELDVDAALTLFDRALPTAWERAGYHDVAELCRHALDVCSRLDEERRQSHEVRYWLQLVSAQTVTEGQSSAAVRDTLNQIARLGPHGGGFTLGTTLRGLEAACSGRYLEASILADELLVASDTDDPIARPAGLYLRGLVDFLQGATAESSMAIKELLNLPPVVDWRRHRHLVAFGVRGYGVAAWIAAVLGDATAADAALAHAKVLADSYSDPFERGTVGISELQARAIMGRVGGTAELAAGLHAALTTAKLDQMAASAKVIECWALALGPEATDTADEMRAALAVHTHDGTRIYLPLYYQLLADVEWVRGRVDAAREALRLAESTAGATGESVWDRQLADRLSVMRSASARLTS